MKTSNRSKIDESWPIDDLENQAVCPYCDSKRRKLLYADIQDWSFYCSPGKWNYWECGDCRALYLDPRPTKDSIGRAYAKYHTHGQSGFRNLVELCKALVRNLYYFAYYNIPLSPRLPFPKFMFPVLRFLRQRVTVSFILQELNRLPKGKIVDVGCGSGAFLHHAKQLGWDTLGIELDPKAVLVLRKLGHNVIQGSYEELAPYYSQFDCVICSHVLEHVHEPKTLIWAISNALKVGGIALISSPNSGSIVLKSVSENWRGLEAPRHIGIPRFETIVELVRLYGFSLEASHVTDSVTLKASLKIAKDRGVNMKDLLRKIAHIKMRSNGLGEVDSDYVNLVLRKISLPSI